MILELITLAVCALSVILLWVAAWLSTESDLIAYRLIGVSMGLILTMFITRLFLTFREKWWGP